MQGGLVGLFGKHRWQLEQRSTWQDPEAQAMPSPLPASSGSSSSEALPSETEAGTPCHCFSAALGEANGNCSGAVVPSDPRQHASCCNAESAAPTALLSSLLSSSSAGARLAALSGATAAAKASACTVPEHMQAHSALPLHHATGGGGGGSRGRAPERMS